MCYSNCPYEKWGNPETAGDCANPSMQGTEKAHCYEPDEEEVKVTDDDLKCPPNPDGSDSIICLQCEVCVHE